MTKVSPEAEGAILVRAADTEQIGEPGRRIQLLADSSATGGLLSSQRVTLLGGIDGAHPHHHAKSGELFYVLGGTVQLLIGDQVTAAREGDLAFAPPGLPHAFAAAPGAAADLLIVITPGVERFEYFRHLARIVKGEATPESLLEVQERYDTWFAASQAWQEARGKSTGEPA
jgi:mannose-6-phosphate isomerase-like protein (cupin superfamily)